MDHVHDDQPTRSPWLAQLRPEGPAQPLTSDVETDVVVVGAGIAGISTAFFVLRDTDLRVTLIERARVGHGATGHNAGQLTTYFERPLPSIAEEFGTDLATQAQRGIEDAHDLLDLMVDESGADVLVERFTGQMALYTLDHVVVHLTTNEVRRAGGLAPLRCSVADDAPFLADIPERFAGGYDVVPRERIHEMLGIPDDRYCAVLSEPKGCANGALLCQQVLAYLQRTHPDRFRYADLTRVDEIRLGASTDAGQTHRVTAGDVHVLGRHVVLCTNAFTDHVVRDRHGDPVELAPDQSLSGLVGYMAAFVDTPREPAALSFVRQPIVGMDQTPYAYTTRRSYPGADGTVTLTCMGGPDAYLDDAEYAPDAPVPGQVLDAMDREILPFAAPERLPGTPYDFHWHGLMGYTDNLLRIVGTHPDHAGLHYNLACNGVGFLPSIYGGHRIGRILAGDHVGPSIFDPRSPAVRAVGADPASP